MVSPFFFAVAGVIRGTFYFEPLRCGPQIIGNRLNIPGRGADLGMAQHSLDGGEAGLVSVGHEGSYYMMANRVKPIVRHSRDGTDVSDLFAPVPVGHAGLGVRKDIFLGSLAI